mmetsp:Transcript_11605/g.24482  ORF Transcript_11605/g.24482 Transcript_11605/m.24482 type:complete len:306 (+) Transcript_11605:566-1483(+)
MVMVMVIIMVADARTQPVQGHRGVNPVPAAAQEPDHPFRIVPVPRFLQDRPVELDDGVASQVVGGLRACNCGCGVRLRQRVRLGPRQPEVVLDGGQPVGVVVVVVVVVKLARLPLPSLLLLRLSLPPGQGLLPDEAHHSPQKVQGSFSEFHEGLFARACFGNHPFFGIGSSSSSSSIEPALDPDCELLIDADCVCFRVFCDRVRNSIVQEMRHAQAGFLENPGRVLGRHHLLAFVVPHANQFAVFGVVAGRILLQKPTGAGCRGQHLAAKVGKKVLRVAVAAGGSSIWWYRCCCCFCYCCCLRLC